MTNDGYCAESQGRASMALKVRATDVSTTTRLLLTFLVESVRLKHFGAASEDVAVIISTASASSISDNDVCF